MCLGVPGRVVRWLDRDELTAAAEIDFGGVRKSCHMACVPDAREGDYVLVHAGVALAVLDDAPKFAAPDRSFRGADAHERRGRRCGGSDERRRRVDERADEEGGRADDPERPVLFAEKPRALHHCGVRRMSVSCAWTPSPEDARAISAEATEIPYRLSSAPSHSKSFRGSAATFASTPPSSRAFR